MVIDNKKKIVAEKISNLLFLALLAIVVVLLFIFDLYSNPVWGKPGVIALIVTGAVYLFLIVLGISRDYHYFYFSDDHDSKFVFRYYSLNPFLKELKTIEIIKGEFYRYEVLKKGYGLQEYLILYQKTPQGIAKYPAISISLLSGKDKNELLMVLNKNQKHKP